MPKPEDNSLFIGRAATECSNDMEDCGLRSRKSASQVLVVGAGQERARPCVRNAELIWTTCGEGRKSVGRTFYDHAAQEFVLDFVLKILRDVVDVRTWS
jgi:hypothetical protein